ncbi:MAG: hypothetical protein HN976_29410 [Lentisphaerae bacterium]|jgi:hypothetical protein|nr:hypothetical protein [Lentisphaerota bacterium]
MRSHRDWSLPGAARAGTVRFTFIYAICLACLVTTAEAERGREVLSLQIATVAPAYPQGTPVEIRASLKNETHKNKPQRSVEIEDLLSCHSNSYSNVLPHMVNERGLNVASSVPAEKANPPPPRPPMRMLVPGDLIVKYIHLDTFIDVDPKTGRASRQPVFTAPAGKYQVWLDCWIRTGAGRRVRLTSNKIWVEVTPVSVQTEPAK